MIGSILPFDQDLKRFLKKGNLFFELKVILIKKKKNLFQRIVKKKKISILQVQIRFLFLIRSWMNGFEMNSLYEKNLKSKKNNKKMKRKNEMPNFLEISKDIKLEIFSYLDRSDLLKLRVQCKKLKELIDSTPKFWKELVIPCDYDPKEYLAYLKIANKKLETLKMLPKEENLDEWREKSFSLLQNLNSYNPNLLSLSFFGCQDFLSIVYPSSIIQLDLRGFFFYFNLFNLFNFFFLLFFNKFKKKCYFV